MDVSNAGNIVALLVGLGTIAGWVLKTHADLKHSIEQLKLVDARQEFKIEMCWQAFMENARLAAVKKDLGGINSPFTINDKARDMFRQAGFTQRLQEYYRAVGRHKTKTEMEMDILGVFRPLMLSTICVPAGFTEGECIALAVEIAREAPDGESVDPGETKA